tara:strand:- start:266 stop:1765 length:1500 start_codon:yes stop_codon:yes gene_type:complete
MANFQENLDNAAALATCQILQSGGQALVGFGAWNLAAGGAGLVPIALGSTALLASNYGCTWDTEQEPTVPIDNLIVPGSCMETNGCGLIVYRKGGASQYLGTVQKLVSVNRNGTYPNGTPKITTTYIDCNGVLQSDDEGASDVLPISTEIADGFVCAGDVAPNGDPIFPPYEYTDPIPKGCSLTVNVLGWGAQGDGTVAPIYKIEPSADKRAGGGVIGGCNFEPVVYYQPKPPGVEGGGGEGDGGDGDPPYTIPFVDGDDSDGEPEWLKLLKQALAGAAGNLVASGIKALLEQPYAGVTYTMTAPCNKDAEGNPLVWTGEIPEQRINAAILDRLDAISNQLSQHLEWKTPICVPETPELEGDFRTISFRSDETSPFGKSRLRKRLRYRSRNGQDLSALVDYWKDFTWTGGSTRVRWTGGAWGTVEVWAASESEGKRVIQHAAGEAGFDAFETGGWTVRVTSSTRLGVSLLMRVDTTGGYYWITCRDGSDNRPLVAYTSD